MKLFICIFALTVMAEEHHKTAFHAWVDGFGVHHGAILSPQYSWGVETPGGSFSGYGFVESIPEERIFTDNWMVYTPSKAKWFSVHTEAGGFFAHDLGFFQIGPRVNFTEVLPSLRKPFGHLFVAVLPGVVGVRPNNILVSGETNPVKIKHAELWAEVHSRFFPEGRPSGEWWILLKPKHNSHFSYGSLIRHAGDSNYIGFGLRASFF